MNNANEVIRSFITENFLFGEANGLTEDTSFLEEGIIDSTGVIELIDFLERTFSIKCEDAEIIPENLDSIGNVVNFIQTKM
jgi:acyl carrier protein